MEPWLNLPPELGRFRHLGAMWGRTDAPLRLCTLVPLQSLRRVLSERVGIDDASELTNRVLHIAGKETAETVLHVDLGPDIGPTLGFEFKTELTHDWPAMFRRLVKTGLCTPDRADALQSWRSRPPELADPKSKVGFVQGVGAVLADRNAITLREINHVKVTRRGGKLSAKAYPFTTQWTRGITTGLL